MTPSTLDAFSVVLVEPRLAINVGTVMRAIKNMGLTSLRLVNPAEMSLDRTQISAHRTEDILASLTTHDSLPDAVADQHHVIGLTARPRKARWTTHAPRDRVRDALARAASGQRVALVFGRESSGLSNQELDRCDELWTIPTRPDYSSLNLSQAALLCCYELFLAHNTPSLSPPAPTPATDTHDHPLPTVEARERLFAQIEHTLEAIRFFKSDTSTSVMRALRRLLHRAQPDARETRMLTGVFVEVLKFARLVQRGVIPADLPHHTAPSPKADTTPDGDAQPPQDPPR